MTLNTSYADNILLINAPEVQKIKCEDTNEKLVDIRDYKGIKLDKKGKWHSDHYFMVRKTVAEKLENAAKLLPENVIFLFKEGHRSLKKQKEIYDWYVGVLKERHPKKDSQEIAILASEWVAKPILNAPHSTGGAVDITLCDLDGNEIDMGSIVDDTSEGGVERNKTNSNFISEKGKANRKILIKALSSQGFQNYPFEWWHWSYGDKYWAYHNKANSFYCSVK